MRIAGSCLCGAVRFELTQDPLWAHNCHCSRCRKTRGAAFAPNLFVGREGVRYLAGQDQIASYRPPGAERFTHAFCRVCGSSLPWLNEAHGIIVVPMGVLDDDPGSRPQGHIFVASKAPWFEITDDLPQSQGAPGAG